MSPVDGSPVNRMSASVVIPAHNEQIALPRLLRSILEQDLGGLRLEIVVVANGSTDQTASVASSFIELFDASGHWLVVLDLPTASKARALNQGDRAVRSFPRLYLDADIGLSPNAIRRTVEELSAVSAARLAAPAIRVAESSTFAARNYGHLWSQLPYIRSKVPGVGFYAVNEAGRRHWWRFPDRVGADDKFVRLHFDRQETLRIEDASFTIYMPETIGELLRVRARWIALNRALTRHCPGLDRRDDSRWISSARYIITSPSTWASVPAFLAVWSGAWAISFLRTAGFGQRWSRATSSRIRARQITEAPKPIAREARGRSEYSEPANTERSVHAIVVMYNSRLTAPRCVESLLASEGVDDLRITAVDNASEDSSAEAPAQIFPGIEIMRNARNVGFAAAVNGAARESTSRWIAIINPDTELRPHTISSVISFLERNSDAGCCGVPAVHVDGSINDRSFFRRPTMWSEIALSLGLHRIAPASRLLNPEQNLAYRRHESAFGVDAVAGCFTVVDRELFEHLAGYDETFFLCGEDLDFGARAVQAGAAPAIVPTCPLLHHSGSSFATRADARVAYLRGRAQYQRRWWNARRAKLAGFARAGAVLARLAILLTLRSSRAEEFLTIWSHRREWM